MTASRITTSDSNRAAIATLNDPLIARQREPETGTDNWNILCRWAFCLSLREETPPIPIDVPADSNVEMTWQVFGGEAADLYLAALIERCVRDGIELDERELSRQFRLHLHRGIGYLFAPGLVTSIADLAKLAVTPAAR